MKEWDCGSLPGFSSQTSKKEKPWSFHISDNGIAYRLAAMPKNPLCRLCWCQPACPQQAARSYTSCRSPTAVQTMHCCKCFIASSIWIILSGSDIYGRGVASMQVSTEKRHLEACMLPGSNLPSCGRTLPPAPKQVRRSGWWLQNDGLQSQIPSGSLFM